MSVRLDVLPFVESEHCRSRRHCKLCRDRVGGRAWRESVGRIHPLPGDQVDFDCPFGIPLDSPPPAAPPPSPKPAAVDPWANGAGERLWGRMHREALAGTLTDAVLDAIGTELPCGACREHFRDLRRKMPFDFERAFAWTVEAHNAVNRRLGKPQMSQGEARARWDDVAAPETFVFPAGFPPKKLLNRPDSPRWQIDPMLRAWRRLHPLPGDKRDQRSEVGGRQKILLRHHLALGDVTVLTGIVRDLHKKYGRQYAFGVDTSCSELWENNPYITPMCVTDADVRSVKVEYPSIHRSNQSGEHFLTGFARDVGEALGMEFEVTDLRGDIHLSAAERAEPRYIDEPYWLMLVPGGKRDYTAKWWSPAYARHVVEHFAGKLRFARVGGVGANHYHPAIPGTIDLVGRTSIRQLLKLIYHCDGIVCPVTGVMHLARAVPTRDGLERPCVVIAGGREPATWERYSGHRFLDTIGKLPCCKTGGCWKGKCQTAGGADGGGSVCERPVDAGPGLVIPECMSMVGPEQVIEAIESYLQ